MPVPCICQNPSCEKLFFDSPSTIAAGGGKYCSRKCWREKPCESLADRFWAKVQRCTHEPWCIYCCWPWQASLRHGGYGQMTMRINGKQVLLRSNRVVWELFQKRPLPEELWALHHCDFPPCCNPAHIYIGTPAQNSQDAVKRGRFIGRYHGEPTKGGEHHNAKLEDADVILMRTLYAQGASLKSLAQQFGVKSPNVHSIVHGKTWKHLL
jgi:hypothetical protein